MTPDAPTGGSADGPTPRALARLGPVFPEAVLWTPERLPDSSWLGHGPFAVWLTGVLRPKRIVELGVHNGFSLTAFCEALERFGLSGSRVYGVDHWRGDAHAGFYDEDVYQDLKAVHEPRHGARSRLVRADFDEALKHFEDGTIDVLHIDGAHDAESVRRDLESWTPKLTAEGVVLFHDIDVRERGFGVWALWDDLEKSHPGRAFAFRHEHGLGVLAPGKAPKALAPLFDAPAEEADQIRALFGRLGEGVRAMGRARAAEKAARDGLRAAVEKAHADAAEAVRGAERHAEAAHHEAGRAIAQARADAEALAQKARAEAQDAIRAAQADAQRHIGRAEIAAAALEGERAARAGLEARFAEWRARLETERAGFEQERAAFEQERAQWAESRAAFDHAIRETEAALDAERLAFALERETRDADYATELSALVHERDKLQRACDHAHDVARAEAQQHAALKARLGALETRLGAVYRSRSWKLAAPLRGLGRLARRVTPEPVRKLVRRR